MLDPDTPKVNADRKQRGYRYTVSINQRTGTGRTLPVLYITFFKNIVL
jgi:hypothetical protein